MCYLLPSLKRKAVRVLFPNSSWLHAYTLRMFIVFLHIGVTHRHLSDHMSDMVENTLNDLEQSKVQYACQLIIDTELNNSQKFLPGNSSLPFKDVMSSCKHVMRTDKLTC